MLLTLPDTPITLDYIDLSKCSDLNITCTRIDTSSEIGEMNYDPSVKVMPYFTSNKDYEIDQKELQDNKLE